MKKALALIGSNQGKHSCTAQFAERIFSEAQKLCDTPFEVEIITTDQLRLEYCQGCCLCFRECICPTDLIDDMPVLKQKLREADFIILGSPVYAHQVSGQMKTIIDRLSYWLHLMPLAGKPGIAISTTAGTGEMEILNYLIKMMLPMGLKPVGGYNSYARFQGEFLSEAETDRKAKKAAVTVANYLSVRKEIQSNPQFEQAFSQMKQMIVNNRGYKPGEYDYWVNSGAMDCETYQEFLEVKKDRKNLLVTT